MTLCNSGWYRDLKDAITDPNDWTKVEELCDKLDASAALGINERDVQSIINELMHYAFKAVTAETMKLKEIPRWGNDRNAKAKDSAGGVSERGQGAEKYHQHRGKRRR